MSLFRKWQSILIGCATALGVASAEENSHRMQIAGQVDWFGIYGQHDGHTRIEDRMERFLVHAQEDRLSATMSWFDYPYCTLQQLHETFLKYEMNGASIRFGRIMPQIGQSSWDDQWYSGIVQLPYIEHSTFDTYFDLMKSTNGVDFTFPISNHTVSLTALSVSDEKNKWIPQDINRAAFRIEGFQNSLTFGFGAMGDIHSGGRDVNLFEIDGRYTVPHWIFRGEWLTFKRSGDNYSGFFVDCYHRPAHWSDVTLVGRYQQLRTSFPGSLYREGITLGVKVRLPYEFSLAINFSFGPNTSDADRGGNWEVGLRRTINF